MSWLALVLLLLLAPSARAVDCRTVGADCSLREAAALVGVLVGAAAEPAWIASDPEYGPVLAREFSSLTAENKMKWRDIHPAPGVYAFGPADALVEFAEAHGMAVRGHNLIWEQELIDSTPEYVTSITDPNALRALMTEHIETVVGHYRGRIDSWDVVNEPLTPFSGTELYPNVFYRLLGPGYIAEALEIAHAADPDAKLFINEVLIERQGARFDALLALVRDLLNAGAPLHGVGIQGHFFAAPDSAQLESNIRALAGLGLAVEITELDVVLRAGESRSAQLEQQRSDYFDIVRACMAVSACRRVTTWGFTDRDTWIDDFFGPGFDPLPLGESYERKPAYFGFRDALLTRGVQQSVPLLPPGLLMLAAGALAAAGGWLSRRPRSHRRD
ncbi:MAG: endo-1,4-beta-xylanase [Myxococcota bacterium]